ncbi:25467_t:CDS:1, partial [Racocetra persica]
MQTSENEKKNLENTSNLTDDHISSGLLLIDAIGNAVESFFPLLKTAATVISEIYKAYDNAKYNLNICNSLMDRINIAEAVVKTLERRKDMDENNFQEPEYYKAFLRFIEILNKIKVLINEVSSLQGYKKFLNSTIIKSRFIDITNDFEASMQELHFTLYVSNEEQRSIDQKNLEGDIKDMSK